MIDYIISIFCIYRCMNAYLYIYLCVCSQSRELLGVFRHMWIAILVVPLLVVLWALVLLGSQHLHLRSGQLLLVMETRLVVQRTHIVVHLWSMRLAFLWLSVVGTVLVRCRCPSTQIRLVQRSLVRKLIVLSILWVVWRAVVLLAVYSVVVMWVHVTVALCWNISRAYGHHTLLIYLLHVGLILNLRIGRLMLFWNSSNKVIVLVSSFRIHAHSLFLLKHLINLWGIAWTFSLCSFT